jgi:hypothetical protein
LKTVKIVNFTTPSLPVICYEVHGEHEEEEDEF